MCMECPRGHSLARQKQASADKDFTLCKCCPRGTSWEGLQQCFVDRMQVGSTAVKMTFEVEVLVECDLGNGSGDWGDERDWCIPTHHEMLRLLKDAGYCAESNSADWEAFDLRPFAG